MYMLRSFLPLLVIAGLVSGQDKPLGPGKLPIKRLVLFKNGVGYFEHVGSIRGNQSVAISFTSGQLNDVLKSLTVLDLSGGRIAGVAYGTSAPINRQLGDLRLPIGEKSSLSEVLSALRGTKIEVRSGGTLISGRLLSIERKTRISAGTTLEVDYLSLISEDGELRTTEVSPSFSVRLLEPGLAGKIDRYLDVVSAGRQADVRNMVISTEGTGDRSLYVSYISEVPVWKSTYRLVLNSQAGKSPLLQGWAIVDNVVGEDWNNVALSLVAGAPQSFIQNLSQPYYAQRPTIALPDTVSTSPQTYESTLTTGGAQLAGNITDATGVGISGASVKVLDASGNTIAQTNTNASGSYDFSSLPNGSVRLQVESPGFAHAEVQGLLISPSHPVQQNVTLQVGNTAQTVVVQSNPSVVDTQNSALAVTSGNIGTGSSLGRGNSLGLKARGSSNAYGSGSGAGFGAGAYRISDARASAESAALSQVLGDLFEYKLKDPITILKNRSALVPIAQAPIIAEKVSIWNERSGLPRPQRAVWLTNTTGLTLDGGSVSVLEDDTFSGEGIFEPIRPGEKRLLSYATDLAVNASSRIGSENQRVSRVVVNKGTMLQVSEVREKKTYTFRNEDSSPRTIILEHPARNGYELKSEPLPAETTADWLRFRLEVQPKQTASLVVEESRPIRTNFALTGLTQEQLALFVSQRSINPAIQSALEQVFAQKNAVVELTGQKNTRDEETQKIFDDQQRLRENIKALKGTPEEKALLQRYTQQLSDQETRLEVLQKESAQLDSQIEAANAKLDALIQSLSFDVKL
jgi:hypothetical protein